MSTTEDLEPISTKDTEDQIDLKKVFNIIIGKWYWFVISFAFLLSVAYFYAKSVAPIYNVSARILITNQTQGAAGGAAGGLMDLGGILGSNSTADNEIEVLKTPDLLEEVVKDLTLNIVYSKKSNFSTREEYQSPFRLKIIQAVDSIRYTTIAVKKSSANKISVQEAGNEHIISWEQPFTIKNVGTVKFSQTAGLLMTNDVYQVDISSVDERVAYLRDEMYVALSNKQVSIIDLSLNYPLQKKGEEILNTLISKYKKADLEDKTAVADSTNVFIKERLNVIATELGDVEDKVQQYKQQNQLADMSEQGKLLVQKTGSLSDELAKAETQITVFTDLEAYLKDETRNKRVFPSALMPSDMVFSNLLEQYNVLLMDRDRMLMSVTSETPFVKNLDMQIVELRKGILANVQNTKNTFSVTRDNLVKQLTVAQSEVKGVPKVEKDYLQLARNRQIKQELYIFLMQKAEETAIAKTSSISIAKVIAKPKAGLLPVSPKKSVIYFFSALVALILPNIVLLLQHFSNTKVSSKEDILENTQIPILGEISHNIIVDNLIVSNNSRSAISEQFRALRSNLSFYLKNNNENVILLTSSMSGEGKSFTAINLANILALVGKKVLLMEMDLRKPGISSKLGLENGIGFSNYVIDPAVNLAAIIKPLSIHPNMFMISSGPIPPNPVEILMSDRTKELMAEVKAQFNYVIVDAPPIGIVSDAQSLVDFAGITLYLVRQNVTDKKQLSIAEELYQSGKMKNMGIVVNDVQQKYYAYGSGYGNYGADEPVGFWSAIARKFKS